MSGRVWDKYLTDQDRAHVELHPARRKGVGERPALVLVDLYRWAFGDEPQPLLESVKAWPGSCGLAGWEALPHIQRLLAEARAAKIPVVHLTGLDEIPGWRESTPRGPGRSDQNPEALDRRRRRYDIVDEVAPVRGEPVLEKSAPSAFWGTPLAGYLNGLRVDTILVAGESTSGCVRATVVDGRSYRYNMVVVEECVFDRHQAAHAINLFDMDQKYADVVSVDEAVAYLRGEPAALRGEAAS
ncbi:MAG TPA: isochorismatase family protein [Solirubrobacterales bacterium]